ncbi:MAG: 2,3-bisphosphoglycerate-dependent phosphoglycerate mutase [Chlamydiota bacterium]|nr:2,3-bisphosphoglycerate-dependent phosphoglycerate mutase [Chlamydiota bacterium]
MNPPPQLVLLRHGLSVWNRDNRFTGWVDVPLSAEGINEALLAGEEIASISFNRLFTSQLIRAQMTLALAMQAQGKALIFEEESIHHQAPRDSYLPVITSSALNERNYGDLQGKNKQKASQEYGHEAIQRWRRHYEAIPPRGESLEMTVARVLPYFEGEILPYLDRGERILITAHGNSLRALIMTLEGLSPEEIVHREVPTGKPLFYSLGGSQWQLHN